ncbi:MAG: tetratricopeptide repeat protein, partial [Polyangiaceae bacterium]
MCHALASGMALRHMLKLTLVPAFLLLGAACTPPPATAVAQMLVRQHRDDDAIGTLRRRLLAHPEDSAARRLLVRLLGMSGQMEAARAEVRELRRRSPPGDPMPDIELGHALELAHRYDEALAAYDEAARSAPLSPDGPREAGMRCARWGEPELARPRLEEAVRRGARDAETWHALGLVRLHMGDDDGAAYAYRVCAAQNPKEPECWLGLATVGIVRGDSRMALSAYDHVLVFAPR